MVSGFTRDEDRQRLLKRIHDVSSSGSLIWDVYDQFLVGRLESSKSPSELDALKSVAERMYLQGQ